MPARGHRSVSIELPNGQIGAIHGGGSIEWVDDMPNRRGNNPTNPGIPPRERPGRRPRVVNDIRFAHENDLVPTGEVAAAEARRRRNIPTILEAGIIQVAHAADGTQAGAMVYADVPTTRRRRTSRAARTAEAVAQAQCNAAPQLLPGLFGHDYMLRAAEISDCGKYRYWLMREWEPTVETNSRAEPSALFVMLNPSTADGIAEDATLRRCISFAKALGFLRLEVVNLFAFRATSPLELEAEYNRNGLEAVCGPDNGDAIMEGMDNCRTIIAGWGERLSKGIAGERAGEILLMAKRLGRDVFCLGKTADGYPRHPLYVRGGTGLETFNSCALTE